MKTPRKLFTVMDVLLLIDQNGESNEPITISEECEQDTWAIVPCNSSLLWNKEISERIVENIGVYKGMIQIWLADKENEHDGE